MLIFLVLLAAFVYLERQRHRIEAREENSASGNVDIRILSQGEHLPPPSLSSAYELPAAAIIIDDYVFRSVGKKRGLHVITLSPDFSLANRQWFDLSKSGEEIDAFCQYVSNRPVNTTILIGTYGALYLQHNTTRVLRERLENTFATLGAQALPFNHPAASWALVSIRRPDGWIKLAEAHSQLSGVSASVTLQPDLSIYDDYDGDFIDDSPHLIREITDQKDKDILEQIRLSKDLFELDAIKEIHLQQIDMSPVIRKEYLERRNELAAQCERKTAIDGALDLLAFKIEKVTEEKYILRWYFAVNEDISEKWTFNVDLRMDEGRPGISPEINREKEPTTKKIYADQSQIHQWKAGEHRILSLDCDLEDSTYDITSHFYQWFPDKPVMHAASIKHTEQIGGNRFPGDKVRKPSLNRGAGETNEPIRVFFSPAPQGEEMIPHFIKFLKTAGESIDCALYLFTLQEAVDVLIAKHKQGVRVRIVSDTRTKDNTGYIACRKAGIPIVFDTRPELMHNKFIIVDDEKVWVGSANLTEVGMSRSCNNSLLIESRELATNFTVEFEEMFDTRLFGIESPQNTKYPTLTIGGASVTTLFAPEDNVLESVVAEIGKADESIDFMLTFLRNDTILEALKVRMEAGVRVRGIISMRYPEKAGRIGFLREHGAEIYTDNNQPYMHNRVFVIDGETVITSSHVFDNAIEVNDESILIVQSKKIAEKYTDEFNALIARERWQPYTPDKPVPRGGIPLHTGKHKGTLFSPILHLSLDDKTNNQRISDSAAGGYEFVFRDLSGNPTTNAHSTSGPVGRAISFDGIDDSLDINGLSVPVDRDCAIALWYRLDTAPPAKLRAFGNYRWLESGFFLLQHPNGLLCWDVMYNGGQHEDFTYTVMPGAWNHFVCQRSGEIIEFFVNGTLAGTYSENSAQLLNGEDLRLGSTIHKGKVSFSMDDLRIYDRALSESEIKALASPAR